ncbi:hypothetical protein GCK72_020551 [Caenorhabditis remanei]|uniref:GH18 domain-containing protein n=1 Tax=Caenorhabditis remanei TaxID=31234 RepID=A0A6A5GH27_CAERE|nr:hypothetical protein GCK72_020551 [Caenorhabditis remanei]KAF1753993.1 hypothetical protein GCK72_020551 [Caenorhabditis remanei]
MSCYQPLLPNIHDMDQKKRSAVTLCNVLLTIFGFFFLFFWFSQFHKSHPEDDLELEPMPLRFQRPETTTVEPRTETAATLFPARTTTFDSFQNAYSGFQFTKPIACGKRIVGYYNGWNGQKLTDSQLQKITHLVFAFMKIHKNGTVSFENDEKKSLFLEMKKMAKEVNEEVKVMFSIVGKYNSEFFGKLNADFKKRKTLINSIVSFLQENQFDGVDIFWKWPTSQDKANYVFLLRELRQKLQNLDLQNPKILSIVTPSVGLELMDGFHLNGILKYVDFVNVETDRTTGALTGAPAPLFSEIGQYKEFNVDWTMRHLACVTGKPSQLNMGVPFYGRYWKGVEGAVEKGDDMWRTTGKDVATGTVFWRNMEKEGWSKSSATWHQESRTPYIWDAKNRMFLGFENEKSVGEKLRYTIDKNLGGLTIWTLEMDDDVDSLLEAVTTTSEDCGGSEELQYQCN